MKKLIVWVSIICLWSTQIGCSKQQPPKSATENTISQSSLTNSNVINTQEFVKFLEKSGYKITATRQDGKSILSGNLTRIDINGDSIGIYEYNSSKDMEQDAKTIRSDGSMIGGAIYEWKATAHFYKSGNIIVSYIGDNKEIIGIIEKFMGQQFAGDNGDKAIYINGLKGISNTSRIIIADDKPDQTGWTPKKQEITLSKITSWLKQANLYKGEIPKPRNLGNKELVFNAYIGPSILNVFTSDSHNITIKPAYYIDKNDNNLYSAYYINNVLEFDYDGQKSYIESNQLFDWLKNDKWKTEFKQF